MFENMRAYAEIDLDAISANVAGIRERIGDKAKILAVIKADGYGHGSIPIAKFLQRENLVHSFAVSTVREAVVLRKGGIKKPILILGYVFPGDFDTVLKYDITTTVFQYETALELNRKAELCGKKAGIHIKIDTGMGRIGLIPGENSIDEIERISRLPYIELEGIFTHFACADMKDKTSMNAQARKFLAVTQELESRGIHIPVRHMCNSAAIIDYEGDKLDMVRAGIILYGYYPSDEVNKENVPLHRSMQIKSRVVYVKTLKKGDTVSYGSTFVAENDTVVATVSIGYADGYPRALSSKGEVLIRGRRAKVLGRVCMDQMMVDVTDIPGVAQGDVVTIIGKDGDDEITVEEAAEKAGTFNYEFICGFARRVPRIYFENGHIIKILDYLEETI